MNEQGDTRDTLINAVELVCTGRGTHRIKRLDQVLRDGVGRWSLASESGLSRGRRGGQSRQNGSRTFRESRGTEQVPGSIVPVRTDDTVTFTCPVLQCARTLSLRGNNFQEKFDRLQAAGVSVLDLSRT